MTLSDSGCSRKRNNFESIKLEISLECVNHLVVLPPFSFIAEGKHDGVQRIVLWPFGPTIGPTDDRGGRNFSPDPRREIFNLLSGEPTVPDGCDHHVHVGVFVDESVALFLFLSNDS